METIFTGFSNNYWNNGDNWDNGIPTSVDDAIFNSESPYCEVDSYATCKSLDFTDFTNEIKFLTGMTVSGNLTLNESMTFTPNGQTITVDANSTISNFNKTFYGLTLGKNNTEVNIVIADYEELSVPLEGLLTLGGAGTSITNITGLGFFYCYGGVATGLGRGGVISDMMICFSGDSTKNANFQTDGNWYWKVNLYNNQDPGGKVYFTGTSKIDGSFNEYFGDVDFTTNLSTLLFHNTENINMNLMPKTYYNLTLDWYGSVTFDDAITVANNLVVGSASGATTIKNGNLLASGATTLSNTCYFQNTSTFNDLTISESATVYLKSTNTFTVSDLVANGTSGNRITLAAETPDSQTIFTVENSASVSYVDATDIDSSLGIEIVDTNGSLDNTENWTVGEIKTGPLPCIYID